jgi:hypothetical protein
MIQSEKIMHNDVHQDNIFISKVTNDTKFNGERLVDYDYFIYKIGSVEIYTPRTKFIAKIGDWGYACKYSEPKVLNLDILKSSIKRPTFYSAAYDVVFFCSMIYDMSPSSFMKRITKWITHSDDFSNVEDIDHRPYIDLLTTKLQHASAEALLTNVVTMGSYLTKPEGKGIVVAMLP